MKSKIILFSLIFLFVLNFVSAEIVKVGSDINFAPFNYYNGDGQYVGIDVEIVSRVFEEMGVEIIHVPRPWKRALSDFEAGATDALYQLTPTKERFKNWSMAGPLRNNNSAYYVSAKSKIKDIKDYSELNGLIVGLQIAYTYSEEFDKAEGFKKERVSSSILNIKKLLRNRIDVIIESELVFDYEVRKRNLENKIRKLPTYAVVSTRYIAFHNNENGKRLAKEFQKTLDRLKANGTVDRIINSWKE